jgi:hypothetical protein
MFYSSDAGIIAFFKFGAAMFVASPNGAGTQAQPSRAV